MQTVAILGWATALGSLLGFILLAIRMGQFEAELERLAAELRAARTGDETRLILPFRPKAVETPYTEGEGDERWN